MQYDIIGDIHGHADKLHALLTKLGYLQRSGAYRHPDRTAIFVGDFIDRGPQQVETVFTVRRMVDAGSALAVMGNHEFNAMAWHTENPSRPGEHLRPRSGPWGDGNRKQHAAFLAEVEDKPKLHAELIDWFFTLPLWLELDKIRVVHACWHQGYMNQVRPLLTEDSKLTPEALQLASTKGHVAFTNVEGLIKGLESPLPEPHSFKDKDGHIRRNVRIRWWDREATGFKELALMPQELREQLPDLEVPSNYRTDYDGSKLVFFGHYWMNGAMQRQSRHAACVDYSAGKGGPLVAYRFEGESEIRDANFVAHQ